MKSSTRKKKSNTPKVASSSSTDKSQQKITSFFSNNNGQGGVHPSPSSRSLGLSSSVGRRIDRNGNSGIRKVQTTVPSREEVIVIDDSDTEDSVPPALPGPSAGVKGTDDEDSVDHITSRYFATSSLATGLDDDDDFIVKKPLTPHTTNDVETVYSDSGDELLSQLDVDEIISSQKKLVQQELVPSNDATTSSNFASPSPSKVINKTPTKSPKARINKFSPLRRIHSQSPSRRGNSASPGRGSRSSSSSGKGSPGGSQFTSPTRRPQQFQSNSASPVVKKLEFPSSPTKPFMPYYLRNFLSVVDAVVDDPFDAHLFNESDNSLIQKFRNMSNDARCLFVRLFQRKWDWKVASTIKYPRIRENLTPVFEELHSAGFLVEIKDVKNEVSLDAILSIMSLPQVTALAKDMNVTSKKTKDACKQALLKLAENKSIFGLTSTADVVKTKTLKLLGPTFQVEGNCRALFARIFTLHSPPQYWEDEQEQQRNELGKILLAEDGTMIYPPYSINKVTVIYEDREDLIRFNEACSLHSDITAHAESKNWDEVVKIGEECRFKLEAILKDTAATKFDKDLPSFLRVYRAGSVFTRICSLGADGYQKLCNYRAANDVIELLLSQTIYLPSHRGHWYIRMSINQKHLKASHQERRETLEKALRDNCLRKSSRLELSERLTKVCEEMARKLKPKPPRKRARRGEEDEPAIINDEDSMSVPIQSDLIYRLAADPLPTRTIQGEKLVNPQTLKSAFIRRNGETTSHLSSVEEFAIGHYQSMGYKNGVHAEGQVVCAIFGLLFWDEIYNSEISDAFRAKYQIAPLDLTFKEFFIRRKDMILDKLKAIRESWTMPDMLTAVETSWNQHKDELSIVNWTIFADVESVKSLVMVMGLQVVANICERLARNYRHSRSGFPDLVVWNSTEFMVVEVKGPGDSLSYKQKVWMDFLLSIGVKTEVCWVQDVSNKRIKNSKE